MSSSCSKKASTAARTRRSRGRSSPAGAAVTSKPSGKVAATERRRISNSDEVSEKLTALKNLIAPPAGAEANGEGRDVAVDELFRDTVDYILRLRTQVVVLRRLIQLSSSKDGGADVNAVF